MTQKTRVLFAIGSMAGGGADPKTICYLRHLDRSKFDPYLYLVYREGEFLDDVPKDIPIFSFWDKHSYPAINYPGRIQRMQAQHLASVMEENGIDALCSISFLLTMVAKHATRIRPTHWFAFEECDPRLYFPKQVKRFYWAKRRAMARAYREVQRAVAVSEGVREGMIDYFGVPPDKVTTITNFIDVDEIDRMARAGDVELDRHRFHIVTMGRLHDQKGHIFLLEAMDRLVHQFGRTDVQLHILGQGPREQRLRTFVKKHGLDQHVVFAGFHRNPFSYLHSCHLFVLPSLYEGFGMVLAEAMACGVPVISTDCPSGPGEILAAGKYGRLVPPGDAAALAHAIADSFDRMPELKKTAIDARRHAEETYSVTAGIVKLEQLLATAAPRA